MTFTEGPLGQGKPRLQGKPRCNVTFKAGPSEQAKVQRGLQGKASEGVVWPSQ